MRRISTTAALATLAVAAASSGRGWAEEVRPSLVATTEIFAFHSDFEINLHDALLEAGRTRWSDKPELFHSGKEASCFSQLPRAARSGWDHAVGFYGETISPPRAQTAQFVVRLGLIGEELDAEDGRELAEIAASMRMAAAPAYRACRWQGQDEENRGWIARLLPLLAAHEHELAVQLGDLYQRPLDGLPIRTDLVETVSWSSANTIYLSPEGGHIWVRNEAGEGPVALETMFHEASHLLVGRGAPIRRSLEEAADELDLPLPRDLWHAVQFVTTGDLVRRVLEAAGEPGYEPMAFAQGIFAEYHEVLEAEWTGYLEGRKTMAEAARDLVRAVAAAESQPPADEAVCPEVPGFDSLLDSARVVLVGELHGTVQSPAFVAALACRGLEAGRSVTVGLEWVEEETERVEAYLGSDGGAEARSALLAGDIWQARGQAQYGATSEAMVDLLESLRRLGRGGRDLSVFLFNRRGRSGSERERLMAEAIGQRLASEPNGLFVILTGNIHSRVARGTPWNPKYEPMGYLLQQADLDLAIVALDVAHAGGSAWLCVSGEPCGPRRQPERGEAATARFAISFSEEIQSFGHHGRYFVGAIEASPPAVADQADLD